MGQTWDFVEIDGCSYFSRPGEPRIPYRVETVRTQYRLADVRAESSLPIDLKDLKIIPSDYPIPLSNIEKHIEKPLDLSYYTRDAFLPVQDWDSTLVGIDSSSPDHYYVYSIRVFPMKYNPVQKSAILYQKLTLTLLFTGEKLRCHKAPVTGTEVTYAFITTTSLKNSLKPLAEWNTKKGYRAQIYDVADIYATTPGSDNPEKMHNFIKDLKNNNGTKYVLIAGDDTDVTPRNCIDPYPASGIDDGFLPGDTYFSCCDGTWGSGGKYGDLGQVDDAIPDVSLTRIAISDPSAMTSWVSDTIGYEKTPPSGSWTSHVTLVAPDCGANGDPSFVVDALYNTYLSSLYSSVKKLLNTVGVPVPSNIAADIDSGTAFILALSHGDPDGWYNGGGGGSDIVWESAEIGKLTNGLMKPAVFSMSCDSNQWDKCQCVGEVFTETAGKGAIGYCGASRLAMAGVDTSYDPDAIGMQEDFCRALKDGYRHQGDVFMQMKTHFAQTYGSMFKSSGSDNAMALKSWNEFDMLGDAVVPYWTQTPKNFAVTSTMSAGSIKVTVKDSPAGTLVQGARVCLWKEPGLYSAGDTDTAGEVTLSASGASGSANLTVTQPNYIPYEGTVSLGTAETVPPVVSVSSPLSGEVWVAGLHQATWTATDNVAVAPNTASIWLSTDSGASWTLVASSQPSNGPYTFDLKKDTVNSDRCMLKVEVLDTSGNPGNGTSGIFTISTSFPIIAITSPAPGAVWNGGAGHNIDWTVIGSSLPANPMNISLSTDCGSTWALLTPSGGIPNVSPWSWDTPGTIDTSHAKIKISCTDSLGHIGENTTGIFTVDSSKPVITVTQPAGGAVWSIGTNQIEWTASDTVGLAPSPIDIYYSTDNGYTWKTMARALANSGSYDWAIPAISSKQCIVGVNATDIAGNTGTGTSGVFTVDALKPEITHTPVPSSIVVTAIGISAIVKDDSAVTVTLSYRGVGASSFTDVAMSASGDAYDAQIPAQTSSGAVVYRITAVDSQALENVTDDYTINIMEPGETGTLSGKVVDGSNGNGLGGALVTATKTGGSGAYSATSQPDGTFKIAGMDAGSYDVKASKQGYITSGTQTKSIETGKETSGVNIVLIPAGSSGATVTGTVTESSGKPISGATVTIGGAGNTTTGQDGKYSIYNVPAGTYTFTVSKQGYRTYSDPGLKVIAKAITTKDASLVKTSITGSDGDTGSTNNMPISLVFALIGSALIVVIIAAAILMRNRKKKDDEHSGGWQPQHIQYNGYPAYNLPGYLQQPAQYQYHTEQQLTDPQMYQQYPLQYQNSPPQYPD